MENQPEMDPGLAALRTGAIGNVWAIGAAASVFLAGPPGSAIRAMHVPVILLAIVVGTAFLTLPAALIAIRRAHRVALGVIGLLLGLSPLFVGFLAFAAFIKLFGYTLKP